MIQIEINLFTIKMKVWFTQTCKSIHKLSKENRFKLLKARKQALIINLKTTIKFLTLRSLKKSLKLSKLRSKLFMMKSYCLNQVTYSNALNTKEIWRSPFLNTARTITKREGMQVNMFRDMFSGCRKLMSRVEKSKGEDLSSLRWDQFLKIFNQKMLKLRKQIKIIKLKIRSADC